MPLFSYSPIDRNTLIRSNASQISSFLHSPESRILIWYQGKLIKRSADRLYFLFEELQGVTSYLSEPVYLGLHESLNYFAYQLNQWHTDFNNLELVSLRQASLTVSDYHLGLLYHSQGILNWLSNHPFCSKCGSQTKVINSGHGRKCSNPDCGCEHYPRIDPAVIFSIINNTGPESKILLARKPVWDEHRHSVVAGFIEPGETLEDAVKREAYEETGLKVNNVRYFDSQPWPFPGQIMLGFSCETKQWDIDLIDHELESANWFSADEIESRIKSSDLKMPFQASISWQLINRWFFSQKNYELER